MPMGFPITQRNQKFSSTLMTLTSCLYPKFILRQKAILEFRTIVFITQITLIKWPMGARLFSSKIKLNIIKFYLTRRSKSKLIIVEDWISPFNIAAIYCPPKHSIKADYYTKFFKSLGNRFIAGGDYNAKNVFWGSRLTLTKER